MGGSDYLISSEKTLKWVFLLFNQINVNLISENSNFAFKSNLKRKNMNLVISKRIRDIYYNYYCKDIYDSDVSYIIYRFRIGYKIMYTIMIQ